MRRFTAILEFTKDFNLNPTITFKPQIPPFTLPVLVHPGGPCDARCVDVHQRRDRVWELDFEYDEKSLDPKIVGAKA